MRQGSSRESSRNAERAGADRGRRRDPRPNPLWGSGGAARPPGGGQSLPGPLWPVGLWKTSVASVRTSRGPTGRMERSAPEMHGFGGPRAHQASWYGRGSLGLPAAIRTAQGWALRRAPGRCPDERPSSLPPLAQAGPAARGLKGNCHPHSLEEKVLFLQVHMATSFRPVRPCSPLCPSCHL